MEIELETNSVTCTVTEDMLEKSMGCGDTETYAIGMMVSLMERAAKQLADRHIPEGFTTVGVMLNTTHVAPTVCGKEVTAVVLPLCGYFDRHRLLQIQQRHAAYTLDCS